MRSCRFAGGLSPEVEDCHPGEEIEGYRKVEGAGQAEHAEEDKGREKGAYARPECVDEIEGADGMSDIP